MHWPQPGYGAVVAESCGSLEDNSRWAASDTTGNPLRNLSVCLMTFSRHKSATTLGRNLTLELFPSPSSSLLGGLSKLAVGPCLLDQPLDSIFSEVIDVFSVRKGVGKVTEN